MGFEKISANLGKEIIAWTKTGSKSILQTRPVKINTENLKLVQNLKKDVFEYEMIPLHYNTSLGSHCAEIRELCTEGLNDFIANNSKKVL